MAFGGEFPRRFGTYVLLRPLAQGGMGALNLALTGARGLERFCVIKTVLPHLADDAYIRRFRDEAKVVVRLSHGNLVNVFDAGMAEEQLYIAMDFVEGKDLVATWNRCAARGRHFPIDIVAYLVKELARGLSYAHAFHGLNLVHRDVSPGNVLLSYSGEVKLTDFGLATSTLKLERTTPGIIFGKLSHMAPEQARHEPLDGRTDIYAAGIILWELLTGRQLFPTRSTDARGDAGDRSALMRNALERIRNPDIEPPSFVNPRVPAALERITLKALSVAKERRYQSGEELRADLAEFLAHTSPSTDADALAGFLRELYGDDIGNERDNRERLLLEAAALLSSAQVRGGGLSNALFDTPRPVAVDGAPAHLSGTFNTDAPLPASPSSPSSRTLPTETTGMQPRVQLAESDAIEAARRPVTATPRHPRDVNDQTQRPRTSARRDADVSPPPVSSEGHPSQTAFKTTAAVAALIGVVGIGGAVWWSRYSGERVAKDLVPARITHPAASAGLAPQAASALDEAKPSASHVDAISHPSASADSTENSRGFAPSGFVDPTASVSDPAAREKLRQAIAAFYEGQFKQAIRLGKHAAKSGAGSAADLLVADSYLRMRQFKKALQHYQMVLRIQPDHLLARRGEVAASAGLSSRRKSSRAETSP